MHLLAIDDFDPTYPLAFGAMRPLFEAIAAVHSLAVVSRRPFPEAIRTVRPRASRVPAVSRWRLRRQAQRLVNDGQFDAVLLPTNLGIINRAEPFAPFVRMLNERTLPAIAYPTSGDRNQPETLTMSNTSTFRLPDGHLASVACPTADRIAKPSSKRFVVGYVEEYGPSAPFAELSDSLGSTQVEFLAITATPANGSRGPARRLLAADRTAAATHIRSVDLFLAATSHPDGELVPSSYVADALAAGVPVVVPACDTELATTVDRDALGYVATEADAAGFAAAIRDAAEDRLLEADRDELKARSADQFAPDRALARCLTRLDEIEAALCGDRAAVEPKPLANAA